MMSSIYCVPHAPLLFLIFILLRLTQSFLMVLIRIIGSPVAEKISIPI